MDTTEEGKKKKERKEGVEQRGEKCEKGRRGMERGISMGRRKALIPRYPAEEETHFN